jgi:hypothetical protein
VWANHFRVVTNCDKRKPSVTNCYKDEREWESVGGCEGVGVGE